MGDFAGIYYWIRLGILVLVSLLAVIVALRLMHTRRFSIGRGIAVVVLEFVALVGMWATVGSAASPVWLIGLLAIGGVLGFLFGRMAKPHGEKLKRSPMAAAVNAIAFVFAAMTLLFGTSYLFAIALLVLGFATGMLIGQLGGEVVAAKSVVAAPPMPGAAPPPMPVAAPPMPAQPVAPPMPAQPVAPPVPAKEPVYVAPPEPPAPAPAPAPSPEAYPADAPQE